MDEYGFFYLTRGKYLQECNRSIESFWRLSHGRDIVDLVHNKIIPRIVCCLGISKDDLTSIQICLEELLRNVQDHADVNYACVFVHYDKVTENLKICVSDNGFGLINRIKNNPHCKNFTHYEIIKYAFEEGKTTKSTDRNRGMGLPIYCPI